MPDVEQHLIEKEMGQVEAFNRGDLDTVLSYFDPQVVGFSSTRHERIEGLEAMRSTFEYYLKAADKVSYDISDPVVRVYDDTAIVAFYWQVTLTSGEETQTVHGRGTHVFVHKADDWVIVHEHFSRAHHS